jgi:hypothetical protein
MKNLTNLPATEKEQAHQFMRQLHKRLLHDLPSPSVVRLEIAAMLEEQKTEDNKHLRSAEPAFLNRYLVPSIFAHMQSVQGISESDAKKSLLSEWYRCLQTYHQNSPRRLSSHPFEKTQRDPKRIMQRWRGQELNSTGGIRKALHQACPDLAFGEPFPHKVLFEFKYFPDGQDPETQLVNGIYETFYYLSMPSIPAAKTHPAWNYDFGCFLAFDASVEGGLYKTWNSITEEVRAGFWEGGNLFVMIIRTSEPPF